MKNIKLHTCGMILVSVIGLCLLWGIQNRGIDFVISVILMISWIYYYVRLTKVLIRPMEVAKDTIGEETIVNRISQEFWDADVIDPNQVVSIAQEFLYSQIREFNVEMLQKKMEYTALQSQINPHFLYNTLETIRGEAIIAGNREIAEMVEGLSSFFRYSISRKGEVVTLRDELNNIKNYMKIMEFRFMNRYSYEVDIDDDDMRALDYYVPRLILQPIVENALQHGLEDKKHGGVVTLEVTVADDLIITVSDNGAGMSLEQLDRLNSKIHSEEALRPSEKDGEGKKKGTGIALSNVNKRIQLLYGKKYGLNVYSSEDCGTDVELVLPIMDQMEKTRVEENSTAD